MKVNVTGKGFMKGVGILPARGIELSETEIRRLFNFNGVRVFDATTGMQITRATFENMKKPVEKKPTLKINVPAIPKVTEPVVAVKKEEAPVEVVPEPPKFETTVTPYITEPVVEETPVVEVVAEGVKEQLEETITETVELNPVEVDTPVVDETASTDEEKKEYKPYYKKNKKNRNNK